MKFSHLIRINDPSGPSVALLSRGQLWQGLVLRAEKPARFVMGLDEVRIPVRAKDMLARELCFGGVAIREAVRIIRRLVGQGTLRDEMANWRRSGGLVGAAAF